MKRIFNEETISKVGSPRRKLTNGLLQIISRGELASQFKLFGGMLDRWSRNHTVTFMPIMHGAGYTWQRLMAQMDQDSSHFERILVAQSYLDGQTAEPVKIHADWIVPSRDITGRDIVLIDDVFDSGDTMNAAVEHVSRYSPRSISSFFMIRKCRSNQRLLTPAWVMFEVDDVWIVGAGLDDGGKFRHLRYIAEKPRSLGK